MRKELLLCSSLLESCLREFDSLTACCCFDAAQVQGRAFFRPGKRTKKQFSYLDSDIKARTSGPTHEALV